MEGVAASLTAVPPTGTTEGMRAQPELPGGIQRDGPVAGGLEGEGAQPVLWASWLWALAM